MGRFRAPAEPIPVVIDDSLCFPFQVELEKLITGVWMRIDLQKLVNLAENDVVHLDNLNQIQEDAYSVISTPANGSDVETRWPLYETDFYTDGNTFLQWRKNKVGPTYATDVHQGFLAVTDGKVKTSTFNAAQNSKSFFTTHPYGLLLRWSNLTENSVELQTSDLWKPSETQKLSTLTKKKLLLNSNQDLKIIKTLW